MVVIRVKDRSVTLNHLPDAYQLGSKVFGRFKSTNFNYDSYVTIAWLLCLTKTDGMCALVNGLKQRDVIQVLEKDGIFNFYVMKEYLGSFNYATFDHIDNIPEIEKFLNDECIRKMAEGAMIKHIKSGYKIGAFYFRESLNNVDMESVLAMDFEFIPIKYGSNEKEFNNYFECGFYHKGNRTDSVIKEVVSINITPKCRDGNENFPLDISQARPVSTQIKNYSESFSRLNSFGMTTFQLLNYIAGKGLRTLCFFSGSQDLMVFAGLVSESDERCFCGCTSIIRYLKRDNYVFVYRCPFHIQPHLRDYVRVELVNVKFANIEVRKLTGSDHNLIVLGTKIISQPFSSLSKELSKVYAAYVSNDDDLIPHNADDDAEMTFNILKKVNDEFTGKFQIKKKAISNDKAV